MKASKKIDYPEDHDFILYRIIFPALFLIFNLFYWILAGDMTTYQFFTGDDSVNIASLG